MKALKTALALAVVAAVGWPVMRATRAGWYEYQLFHLPRTVPTMPVDAAQLGLQPVEFTSADGTVLRGWYIPSTTGAAIVTAGGSSSDRTNMLDHARALRGSGLGVLLFDWPGTGASDGKIGLGRAERDALRGAIRFVAGRADVTPGRIGLLGFSLGAYTSVLVAADEPGVRVVAVEGAFRDFEEQARIEYQGAGIAAEWGAIVGARLGGMERNGPDVLAAAARIAPRPLLFVSGTADHTVPPSSTQRVIDAARPPTTSWLIAGAGHGEYLATDPTYGRRLRQYLAEALIAHDTAQTR